VVLTSTRSRLLGLGLLITLAEFSFFLATIEYSQLRSVTSRTGRVLLPAGFSRSKKILSTWVYYFFQTIGSRPVSAADLLGMVGFT
jgi:hypothetical protein